jgi:hypothetical protein
MSLVALPLKPPEHVSGTFTLGGELVDGPLGVGQSLAQGLGIVTGGGGQIGIRRRRAALDPQQTAAHANRLFAGLVALPLERCS